METQYAPLSDRVRPEEFDFFVGQDSITSEAGFFKKAIEKDQLFSMIFWGPPGSGKTTLAKIISKKTKNNFISFSAVKASKNEIKKAIEEAATEKKHYGKNTILFIDEIHRFNKAQQDIFLPFIENGTIFFIGATTENPSFYLNSALLSRVQIFVLEKLSDENLQTIIKNSLSKDRELEKFKEFSSDKLMEIVASMADGDARRALNMYEIALRYLSNSSDKEITPELVGRIVANKPLSYDRDGEEHYNLISALHKSIRNSDVDASLYWVVRMLESGEEPLYIARRLIRVAVEDIGNADPEALKLAIAAKEVVVFLGAPEGNLALAQLTIYLSTAPKSNSVYLAYKKLASDLKNKRSYPVPMHLRNAPTKLMKGLGYGEEYLYAHDYPEKTTDMDCFPSELKGKKYYSPVNTGFEKKIIERKEYWERLKEKIKNRGKNILK